MQAVAGGQQVGDRDEPTAKLVHLVPLNPVGMGKRLISQATLDRGPAHLDGLGGLLNREEGPWAEPFPRSPRWSLAGSSPGPSAHQPGSARPPAKGCADCGASRPLPASRTPGGTAGGPVSASWCRTALLCRSGSRWTGYAVLRTAAEESLDGGSQPSPDVTQAHREQATKSTTSTALVGAVFPAKWLPDPAGAGVSLQRYLRWRNATARHPAVLATQRRERIRSEKGIH